MSERQVSTLRQELEASRMFGYALAHELRSPIRVISGYTELLLQHGTLAPPVQAGLQNIHKASRDIGATLAALMPLLEFERSDTLAATLNIAQQVQAAADALSEHNLSSRLTVRCTNAAQVHCSACGLQLVLRNVLSNAVQHSGKPHEVRIAVGVEQTSGTVTITIRDDGKGINAADRVGAFEAFRSLSVSPEGQGLGLGLAISKLVLARMGGQIWFGAETLAGACLHIRLPAPGSVGAAHTTSTAV